MKYKNKPGNDYDNNCFLKNTANRVVGPGE